LNVSSLKAYMAQNKEVTFQDLLRDNPGTEASLVQAALDILIQKGLVEKVSAPVAAHSCPGGCSCSTKSKKEKAAQSCCSGHTNSLEIQTSLTWYRYQNQKKASFSEAM